MNIEALRNIIHREVRRVLDRRTRRTPCIVDSYNPQTHAVKVKLQPEGTLSGWMQIETDQIGLQVAPNIGDPGWIEFHEDDRRAGVFVGSSHNNPNPPPVQIAAGEWRYQNKSGSWAYFKSDGSITLIDKGGSIIAMDGQGDVTITATNIVLNGTVTLGGAKGSGVPAAKQGTVDTGGYVDTSDLATKVNVN